MVKLKRPGAGSKGKARRKSVQQTLSFGKSLPSTSSASSSSTTSSNGLSPATAKRLAAAQKRERTKLKKSSTSGIKGKNAFATMMNSAKELAPKREKFRLRLDKEGKASCVWITADESEKDASGTFAAKWSAVLRIKGNDFCGDRLVTLEADVASVTPEVGSWDDSESFTQVFLSICARRLGVVINVGSRQRAKEDSLPPTTTSPDLPKPRHRVPIPVLKSALQKSVRRRLVGCAA